MVFAASAEVINFVWGTSLLLGVVVILVVALLLHGIRNTARRILRLVGNIWTHGQRVANNTVHIAFLDRVNHLLAGALAEATPLAQSTAQIAEAVRRTGGRL
jgi:uncharacterized membrane protein YqhA